MAVSTPTATQSASASNKNATGGDNSSQYSTLYPNPNSTTNTASISNAGLAESGSASLSQSISSIFSPTSSALFGAGTIETPAQRAASQGPAPTYATNTVSGGGGGPTAAPANSAPQAQASPIAPLVSATAAPKAVSTAAALNNATAKSAATATNYTNPNIIGAPTISASEYYQAFDNLNKQIGLPDMGATTTAILNQLSPAQQKQAAAGQLAVSINQSTGQATVSSPSGSVAGPTNSTPTTSPETAAAAGNPFGLVPSITVGGNTYSFGTAGKVTVTPKEPTPSIYGVPLTPQQQAAVKAIYAPSGQGGLLGQTYSSFAPYLAGAYLQKNLTPAQGAASGNVAAAGATQSYRTGQTAYQIVKTDPGYTAQVLQRVGVPSWLASIAANIAAVAPDRTFNSAIAAINSNPASNLILGAPASYLMSASATLASPRATAGQKEAALITIVGIPLLAIGEGVAAGSAITAGAGLLGLAAPGSVAETLTPADAALNIANNAALGAGGGAGISTGIGNLANYLNTGQLLNSGQDLTALTTGALYGALLAGATGAFNEAPIGLVSRAVPTTIPSDVASVLSLEDISPTQAALSNPDIIPSAQVLSLKTGGQISLPLLGDKFIGTEGEIPLINRINGQFGLSSPTFESGDYPGQAVSVASQFANINNISPVSEGSATIVQSYLNNLEAALGPDAWQVKYLQSGLNLASRLKDASLPTNAGELQLSGVSPQEMGIIRDALANPAPVAGITDAEDAARLYGTGSTQLQLGPEFRPPHDLDIKLSTESATAKTTYAGNLAAALNDLGEQGHVWTADGNKILLNGEKIIEIKSNVPEPEDIEGIHLQNNPEGLKLGYLGTRESVIAPEGYPAASLGETLLGKLSSALAPREVIDPETGEAEITLASAAKRADELGSKDVADTIAIAQRYLEAKPDPFALAALENFKQLALTHTTVDTSGNVVPLVTQAKIDESLNAVDTQGITVPISAATAPSVAPIAASAVAGAALQPYNPYDPIAVAQQQALYNAGQASPVTLGQSALQEAYNQFLAKNSQSTFIPAGSPETASPALSAQANSAFGLSAGSSGSLTGSPTDYFSTSSLSPSTIDALYSGGYISPDQYNSLFSSYIGGYSPTYSNSSGYPQASPSYASTSPDYYNVSPDYFGYSPYSPYYYSPSPNIPIPPPNSPQIIPALGNKYWYRNRRSPFAPPIIFGPQYSPDIAAVLGFGNQEEAAKNLIANPSGLSLALRPELTEEELKQFAKARYKG